jgi:quercetin dioxygenase-like cupin family protein
MRLNRLIGHSWAISQIRFRELRSETKKLLITIGAAALLGMAAVALATPPAGILFNIILSTGVASDDLDERVKVGDWKVRLDTKGATDFYMQDIAIAPGGYSGWHSHPGLFVGTVISGSIDYYDENCNKKTITAGQVWTEAQTLHAIANHGTEDFHGQFVYFIKHGEPRRVDLGAPACAPITGIP